jgi:hypothetical protein
MVICPNVLRLEGENICNKKMNFLPNLPANKCVIVANERDENVDYIGPVTRGITGEKVIHKHCEQTERKSLTVNDALHSHNNHLTTYY